MDGIDGGDAEWAGRVPRNVYLCVHIWVHMTSKNISITEDVYRLLSRMKLEGESFSNVIRRLARRRSLADSASLWSELPEEELEAFTESLHDLRGRARQSLGAKGLEGR